MGEVGYMSESQIRPMLTVEGEKGKGRLGWVR